MSADGCQQTDVSRRMYTKMSLTKIPIIQHIFSFTCKDPVDLFRYSSVCENWTETASKYANLSADFDILSDRTVVALERGSNGVFDALLIASRSFDPLELEAESEKSTLITKVGLIISKNFHRAEAVELMKWLGLSQYQICYFAAWNGNKVIFDLTKEGLNLHDSGVGYINEHLEGIDDCLSDSGFCQTCIMGATIHGGNMDIITSAPSFCIDNGGNGLTEYDLAALSCNREVVWHVLVHDIAAQWRYRKDDVYEMFDDSLDVEEAISSINHPNPKFPDTYRFMRYLGQCNHLPYRGPDENDEWERAKFEKLFEQYPNWYSVQTLLVFKKKHFYDIIVKNIKRISPKIEVPYKFFRKRVKLYNRAVGDELDLNWLRTLLIEERYNIALTVDLDNSPNQSFIECLDYEIEDSDYDDEDPPYDDE